MRKNNVNPESPKAGDKDSNKVKLPKVGDQSKTSDSIVRSVPAMKVAQMKRIMDGAEKRMLRLEAERDEVRAIIQRKYTDQYGDDGETVVGRNLLSPEHIFGFRLKRTEIETDLAVVKGDFLKARRTYRGAVKNNMLTARKSLKMVRMENKILRESKKLLNKTLVVLREHGSNGGAKEFNKLKKAADTGDVKAFRSTFDDVLKDFDPAHHVTISGLCTVKTEIIHSVMDQLADPTSSISTIGQLPVIDSIEV